MLALEIAGGGARGARTGASCSSRRAAAPSAALPQRRQRRRACAHRRSRGASRACPRRRARRPISPRATTSPWQAARRSRRLIYPVPEAARPGRAPDARPRRPGHVRSGRRMGRRRPTICVVDPRARRRLLCRGAHATGRRCPTARCVPGYAGIRPKISGPGEPAARFRDRRARGARRARGWSICSASSRPGLTSSLAIARHVAALLP